MEASFSVLRGQSRTSTDDPKEPCATAGVDGFLRTARQRDAAAPYVLEQAALAGANARQREHGVRRVHSAL